MAAIVPPQPIWPEVKEPMAQSSSDGSEDCAICFEPVHADDRLPLPCRCQLTYCLTCWDRALAAAFNDNGLSSLATDVKALHRTEIFPGLGWMVPSIHGGMLPMGSLDTEKKP